MPNPPLGTPAADWPTHLPPLQTPKSFRTRLEVNIEQAALLARGGAFCACSFHLTFVLSAELVLGNDHALHVGLRLQMGVTTGDTRPIVGMNGSQIDYTGNFITQVLSSMRQWLVRSHECFFWALSPPPPPQYHSQDPGARATQRIV